jgi:hypothetical protein
MRKVFTLLWMMMAVQISLFAQPANDECTNAATLTPAEGNIPNFTDGSTVSATQSLAPCSGTTANDVWYKFVATKTEHRVVAQRNGMASSPIVQIFSGTCGELVSILCFSGSPAVGLATGLTIGTTYFVRVYAGTNITAGEFKVAIISKPQNDECNDAIALTPAAVNAAPNYIAASSIGATLSEPACDGQLITDDDVWFKFIATSNAHRINIRGFLQNASMVEVYSGSCAAKTRITNCNDFSNGGNPGFVNLGGLTAGTEYFFRVFSVFSTPASASSFEVAVTTTVAPANDDCTAAETIPVNGVSCQTSFASTLANATSSKVVLCASANTPNHLYRDVWFKFVATAKAHFISTTFQLQLSRDLTIFSGDCNSLVAIGCQNISNVTEGIAIGSLTVGQTYFVRVGSSSFSDFSNFNICVSTPVFDANDDCASAFTITSSGNTDCNRVFGNNANASQSGLSCVSANLTTTVYDQWYKFTADQTQYRLRMASAQSVRLSMEVLRGNCGTLTTVTGGACTSSTTGNDTIREVKITGLTLGETYFVRVAGDRLIAGAYNLCLKAVVPPVNDDCGGAKELAVASDVSTIALTGTNMLDVTQSSPACSGTANDDLWYTFEATSNNIGALTIFNFIDPHVLQVFSGACDNLVQVSCTQLPNNTSGRASFQLKNLTPGTRYRMRLHGSSNFATTGNGQFTQNIGIYALNIPANDACANAIVLTPAANNTCTAVSGLTVDATNTRASCVNNNTRDVWFKFEATAASHFLQIWGALFDPRIELLQGTCDNLTSVVCFNDATPQIGRRQFNNLVPGTTYFIKVSSNEAFIDREGVFRICLTTPSAPPNDECAGAITLPVCSSPACDAQGLFSTNLATQSRPTCAGSLTANDVWFKFSTDKEVTIAIDNFNAQIRKEVFTGTCDNLTSVLCTNLHISSLPKPVGMTEYFVRVYNNASSVASTEFSIKVYETPDIKFNSTIDTVCLKSNVVLNPSFEFASACPTGFIGSASAGGLLITNWRFPTTGTSDFFNACQTTGGNTVHIPTNQCFGTQEPKSGRGYVGLFAVSVNNYREYIQGELSAPMVPGKKYLVSYYVSLAEYSNTAIDRMGIHFKVGSTAVNSSGPLSFIPQLESTPGAMLTERKGWVNISGVIEPTEAFTHFIIGNFRNNATSNTATVLDESMGLVGGTAPGCVSPGVQGYYFIDDVFIGEIDETAGAACGTLPVTWLSFDAQKVNADAHLAWRTAQEQRCSLYEVERSTDGVNYQKVGQQICRNSQSVQNYNYVDLNPGKGTFYYRLRQVDTDGKFEYSAVRRVSFGQDGDIRVYPNPARDVVQITNLPGNSDIRLYDASGRMVLQSRNAQPFTTLQVGHLPSGLYELLITTNTGERKVQKVQIMK